MREAEETTRQRIARTLRNETETPSGLAAEFDVSVGAALDHVTHLAHSLEPTDEELLVAPPTCRECGFDEFDDPANVPSRCPECKHEGIEEPAFRID
jgi:hypothetical protein